VPEVCSTNSTGREEPRAPNDPGLLADTRAPGMRRSRGLISALISCCERVRAAQSARRPVIWKRDTSGLPLMISVDSISGTWARTSPAWML
jgi:hypothetical protein